MNTVNVPRRPAVKARILGLSVLDVVIDVTVPAVLTAALVAAAFPSYLALTASGILVGVKAALGRVEEWRLDRRAVGGIAAAAVALVVLVGLWGLGAPDVVAAAVAGAVGAVPVVATVLSRSRRIDVFGLLVLAELAASVVVTLISDDPRFVLARPAVYTAVAGIGALLSCRWGRPWMLDASKPMAAAGDPARAAAFETAWRQSSRFRAIERAMTAGLGVVLLVESVLRVAVVYGATDPRAAVTGLLAQVPAVALLVGFVLAVRVVAVPRVRPIVDGFVVAGRTGPAVRHERTPRSPRGADGSRSTSVR